MNLSLNEFQALVKKATRGAGLSWGASAETARAMRLAWCAGVDLTPELIQTLYLHQQRGPHWGAPVDLQSPWHAESGGLSPLIVGLCLCDQASVISQDSLVLTHVVQPQLVLAFALLALHGTSTFFSLALDQQTWTAGSGMLQGEYQASPDAHQVQITQAKAPVEPIARRTRVALSQQTYVDLDALAQHTYAPATEASRLAGAGAGLSDND